jgi:hypothetical protein
MQLVPPFWFKQRQGKAEPAGENTFKLTAPNQGEAFIRIQPGEGGRWSAAVQLAADGPDLAATKAEFDRPGNAWDAAFELYRTALIV